MGLFDEFLTKEVNTNVYNNATNKKVKEEKKKQNNLITLGLGGVISDDEDRFLTKKEIQYKKFLAYKRGWHNRLTEKLRLESEEETKKIIENFKQIPYPITTPSEWDNLYLNTYIKDIGGERYVGERPKWKTAYGLSNPKNYFYITCPIKLIPSRGLKMRYDYGMEVQYLVADFLRGREDEIRRKYNVGDFSLREGFNNGVGEYVAMHWAKTIKKEWQSIYGRKGTSVMAQAVIQIYTEGRYSPSVGLYGVGNSYLIGDAVFDGFGHCDYASNFWNPDYMQHRELLHSMMCAIRNPNLDKELLQKIPYFVLRKPIIIRVPSNKIEHTIFNSKKSHKSPYENYGWTNNGEWDYYWTSTLPTRDFPSWKEIKKRFKIEDETPWDVKPYHFKKEYNQQPLPKSKSNFILRND